MYFKNVGSYFKRLQQIILIEDFKTCILSDIKTYLDVQKVETLEQAAAATADNTVTVYCKTWSTKNEC